MAGFLLACAMFLALLSLIWNSPSFIGAFTNKLTRLNKLKEAALILEISLHVARFTDCFFKYSALRITSPRLRFIDLLAICYFRQGKYSKVFELEEEKLQLLKESKNHAHAALEAKRMAIGHMLAGRMDQALNLSERCVPILRNAYKNSLSESAQPLEQVQSALYKVELAECLFGRAWILEEMRRFSETEVMRLEALELIEEKFGSDSSKSRLTCLA